VPPLDISWLRRSAEEFLAELEMEEYLHYSGQQAEADASSVFARYPGLFSRATLEALRTHYAGIEDPWEKRQTAYLYTWVTETYVANQLTSLADQIANTESRATVEVDGESIGYRYAAVVLANEANRDRRRRLYRARLDTLERELNPLYDMYWRRAHQVALELGYSSYEDLFAEIKAMNHGVFYGEVQSFVQETNSLYQRQLDKLVRQRLGISLSDLEMSDVPYLFRAPEYDRYFSTERLLPTLHATLAGLGIDPLAQHRVHMDTEARPNKSPRAFCAPVRVPDEIYLCVMPHGGQDDYQALLHESGHAQHFAHVHPDQEFEYRCLGDNAVTEGFAFLFDHLPYNPLWLQQYLGYADAADYVRFGYISELFFIRRYVGKFVYELQLHRQNDGLDGMAKAYSAALSDALMIEVPPEHYLADVDPGFYVGSYLRAWFLEAAMRMILQTEYSKAWFRNPGAGEWLRAAWSMGQKHNSPQLLLKLGGGKLNADPLRFFIEGVLGR